MKPQGASYDNLQERLIVLQNILDGFRDKRIRYTQKMVLDELEQLGHKISRDTLYRDMTKLRRESTWVRDLAESNYSGFWEDIWDSVTDIRDTLNQWVEKPDTAPKIIKQVQIPDPKDSSKTVVKEQVVETLHPITIMEKLLTVNNSLANYLKGEVLDTSVALVEEKIQHQDDLLIKKDTKIAELEQKLTEFVGLLQNPNKESQQNGRTGNNLEPDGKEDTD